MIRYLERVFALTEQGAKDLLRASLWQFAANISLMLPVGLLVAVLDRFVRVLGGEGSAMSGMVSTVLIGAALILVILMIQWKLYDALYISTYKESANRRIRLGEKLRALPLSFFGHRDLSDLTATMMGDCSFLEQTFSHYIPEAIGTGLSSLLIAAGLIAMNWRMGLAVVWVIPVSAALVMITRRIQMKYGERSMLDKRAATDSMQELLETMKDIKACNQKDAYLSGLKARLEASERSTIRSELITGSSITAAQAFLKLGIATTALVGITLLVNGEISFLILLIFLFAATRLYDPVSGVFANLAATFAAQVRIERMRQIEEQPVQTGTETYAPKGYDIVFDHVRFAYNKDEGVLEDVSFTARQGEVTALVGPSGGGKSTAAKLAARFWDVDGGRITLGGVDVSTVEPEALLAHYAIVFQDVVLFRDTIMENIRLGRRGASDEEVLAAAKAAQCDEFVSRLPDGYQTLIGENGSTLSGGERQRISIARALLKDADVILLDEATASLDVESETAVQAALSRLVRGKTVLIIAHRMRTVAGADKIVVLSDGRVAEQGTHGELLEKHGIYHNLFTLQQESGEWRL
ncbi:MAG: ABC transporter ATP-binding protein [Clostridia bacterium]|nr:ABC transporter ATP-binding protein [Clostridia bacterium]